MKCTSLFLFFFIISCEVKAQYATDEKPLILKLDMLTLVNDLTFPLAQLSLEKRLSKHFSLSPEAGIQPYAPRLSKLDTSMVKWNGFRIGIEGRYYGLFRNYRDYDKPNRAWAEKYLSLNIFYRQNRYNSSAQYYKPNDAVLYNDSFAAYKKAWGINAIFGIQVTKKRFVANFYGGIGLLSRTIKNRFREYDYITDELEQPSDITISGIKQGASFQENSGTIGNIVLGIRLGFRL